MPGFFLSQSKNTHPAWQCVVTVIMKVQQHVPATAPALSSWAGTALGLSEGREGTQILR